MDNVTEGSEEVKPVKLSQIEIKRLRILEERRKRLINKGVAPEKVDGELAKEDYEALPVERKMVLLEQRIIRLVTGAVEGLRRDITNLQHNDTVIADALDINLIALAQCLELAGVSKEAQAEVVKTVQKSLQEEAKKRQEVSEKDTIVETVAAEEKKVVGTEELAPVQIPDGATVFEG